MIGLDHRLQQWIVTHRAEPFDAIFVALSWVGTFGAVFLALALALAVLRRRPGILLAVLAAVLAGEGIVRVLKPAIGRARPPVAFAEPPTLVHLPHDASFPSGHATNAFACATVLALAAPRLAPLFALLAVSVAFSRVYVGVHYPADVAAGALLGFALGLAVALAAGRLSGRGLRSPRAGRRGSLRSPPRG